MDQFPLRLPISADIQDFFSGMFEDILAGRVTLESVILVLAFFGLFFLLTALSYIFQKKPRELIDQPATWVTDLGRIMELLDSAVTQRSKVRTSFHRDLGAARSTDGVFVSVNKDVLVLEMSSVKTVSPAWIGRTLELSFRLRLPEQPKLQSTFAFESNIISYEQVEEQIAHVRISRPPRLEINQNRLHLRVEPSEKHVQAVRLWTEESVRRRGDPKDPDTWGEPLYATQQGDHQELVIRNISGGGLRLEITPAALRAKANKISLNQHYYCQLTLADPDLTGYATHYVLLTVLKCYDDCDSKTELSLGFSYVAVGIAQDPPLAGLGWRTVSKDFGVRELDDWAYELHLELYRNKGIA